MMIRLLELLMMVGVLVGMSGCGKEIKVWKEEYSKDKVKEEYQYYHHPKTNRRIKDGWYNSYYENGKYYEVGRYKEDVKEGKWVSYDKEGNIMPLTIQEFQNLSDEELRQKYSRSDLRDFARSQLLQLQAPADARSGITPYDPSED